MLGMFIRNSSDVIALVLLFGLTIFVHEFGHFIAALRCGLVIDTFSIGFGPAIWKRKIRGITFKIGILPLGGYVMLPQLDPAGMEKVQGKPETDPPRDLPPIPPWKKIVVSLAGAAGNIIFAFVLAWIVYLSPADVAENGYGTVVGYVATNSVAAANGLLPGDEIVSVNGEKVRTWQDVGMATYLAAGRTNAVILTVMAGGTARNVEAGVSKDGIGIEGVGHGTDCVAGEVMPGSPAEAAGLKNGDLLRVYDGERIAGTAHFVRLVEERGERETILTVEREGRTLDLTVTPKWNPDAGKARIGVVVAAAFDFGVMPWMQHKLPLAQIRGDAAGIFRILKALTNPREAKQAAKGLGGPVMIIATLWIAIKTNFLNAVGFLRLLNVNLAIINLLPLPILDGGHIVFSAWEAITRRRAHPKLVTVLMNVFAALLLAAFLALTFSDFQKWPRMFRALRAATAAQNETAGGSEDEPAAEADTE